MLQRNNTRPALDREAMPPEFMSAADSFRHIVSFVRRQLPVIIFVTILAMALGVIYVVAARPMFTARAQLLIDAHKLQIFQQQSILGDLPIDSAQTESQAEILKSENIASAVIKNLRLTEDPEFAGSGGGLLGAIFGAVFNESGSNGQAPSEFELFRHTMKEFQKRLTIKRIGLTYVIQIGFESYNGERAAQIANAIADAYIIDQLESKYQATRRASVWLQDRIKELRNQVTTAERAVVDFKTKNNIVSTGGTDKRLVGQQQVAELNSQLVIARANTAETRARLDRIEAVLKADSPNASVDATVSDTLKSQVVQTLRSKYLELAARESDWSLRYGHDHLAVVSLRSQMREIRNSIFEELKRLGETYKSDYAISKQREEGVRKELAQAVSQSQTTDSAQIALRELESTAQTYKTLYDNFLQRYMESVQQQSFPITEARLISSASRPLRQSTPNVPLILGITAMGGIILGFAIGGLRDLSDRVFRDSEQVENLLHTECIALVPLLAADPETGKSGDIVGGKGSSKLSAAKRGQSRSRPGVGSHISRGLKAVRSLTLGTDPHGAVRSTERKFDAFGSFIPDQGKNSAAPPVEKEPNGAAPRTIVRGTNAAWTVVDSPLSRFTESIRSIKLASDLIGAVKANRVIGITSSLPDEGKSTIAFSLGQLMAQVSARTILVDCDLRNPSLSRDLTPRATAGLVEVIAGKVPLEQAIWKDQSTNLSFLPIVAKYQFAHSTEMLSSVPVRKLFEQLRESYDYVVVDFPPIAPIVDVRAATHLVDSFVFVVEWGRTKIDVVEHTLGHAQGIYDNLVGVVLNKVDMNIFGRYTAYRGTAYNNKNYARYGYTD